MKKIYACLDTETTDLLKPDSAEISLQPYMTEIYAVKINEDFEFIEDVSFLINVPVPVPEFITKLTNISDEMLENEKPFSKRYKKLSKFFTGVDGVIGHNINFDMDVLKFELRRIGKEHCFPWPRQRICTVEKSFPLENKRLKLGQLYNMATGKTHEGSHRAKADVEATLACFKWLDGNGYI